MSRLRTSIEIKRAVARARELDDASPVAISGHGRRRRAQRGFRADQVEYVVRHGAAYRRAGATFYVLRRRDLPLADRRDDARAKLVGMVVIVEDEVVTTVYRNDHPVRHVLKKAKYDARRLNRTGSWPHPSHVSARRHLQR